MNSTSEPVFASPVAVAGIMEFTVNSIFDVASVHDIPEGHSD